MVSGSKISGSEIVIKPTLATTTKKSCLVVNPPTGVKKRTIVVVGVERGGTSMIAAVLRAIHINMGERAGLNHEDPRFLRDDKDRLKVLIAQRNSELDVWGFKTPKSTLILDFYEQELRNPYYVIVYRNIAAIADSWEQRGSSLEYISPIGHTMTYYNKIFDFMNKTDSPLLIVNYERAVQSKEMLVKHLAEFTETPLAQEDLSRAVAMITGDGRGYVNLPEHYFLVEPKDRFPLDDEEVLLINCNKKLVVSNDGVFQEFETQHNKIIWNPIDGSKFPRKFLMIFEFDIADKHYLEKNIFRIYFDFLGEFFPGHATRPYLGPGKNILYIETNGQVKRVAVGAMVSDVRACFENVRFFELPDEGDYGGYLSGKSTIPDRGSPGIPTSNRGALRMFFHDVVMKKAFSIIRKLTLN